MIVLALCGLPGSGKSTLARELERVTGWQRLDRDALRARHFDYGGYTSVDKQVLALHMRGEMRAWLARGASVILDGMTFSSARERAAFAQDAAAGGAHWRIVWLDCERTVARERIAMDAHHPARDRTPALVDEVASRFEPPTDALRLNASQSVDQLVRTVLATVTENRHAS